MALPVAQPLDALGALDRTHLHLFVAGPGQGEGLAVALPGAGWILVDGCRATAGDGGTDLPLEAIVHRFGAGVADPVVLMVLTHPHEDHATGFADLLEAFDPPAVGVTGLDPPGEHLLWEAEDLVAGMHGAPTEGRLRRGAVLQALNAIANWEEAHAGALRALYDGVSFTFGVAPVSMDVRSPDRAHLGEVRRRRRRTISEHANRLSAVIELVHGRTRVVLGADLPRSAAGRPVRTGWNLVMTRHPHLADHAGLKVPHHGSRDALHPTLVAGRDDELAWVLTPFSSSRLPRTDDGDGLDQLLAAQSPVHLTAPSLARRFQAALDEGRVQRDALRAATAALPRDGLFGAGDTLWRAGTAVGPLDGVWCLAFDDAGHVTGRWRGRAACEVVRA